MSRLITENRGLLLLGAFASLGALSLFWPAEQDSAFEEVAVGESQREWVGSALSVPQATFREIAGEQVVAPPSDRPRRRTIESIADRVESSLEFRPWLSDPRQKPEPAALAETRYELKWEEFIESIGLENEPIIRAVIAEWEQFNTEIYRAWSEGQITQLEMADNRLSIEDLQARLAPYLTSDQLVDIGINNEAYGDYLRETREIEEARRDSLGYNYPLLRALHSEGVETIHALVDSGADVNHVTADGVRTPLGDAILLSKPDMVALLINAGANVDWANNLGYTHLMNAVGDGKLDMVQLLISRGADLEITASPDRPNTVLTIAALDNETEIVRELLRVGADATGEAGESAMRWARRNGNAEIERMLRDAGAK